MNFLFDFDKRDIECKHHQKTALEDYINYNSLTLATCVLGNADDIDDNLGHKEQTEFFELLMLDEPAPNQLDNLPQLLWDELINTADDYPTFTIALGTRLLKSNPPENSNSMVNLPAKKTSKSSHIATQNKAKPKKQVSKRINDLAGKEFEVGDVAPKKGRHTRIVNHIDEGMGATYDELVELLADDKGDPAVHIKYAVNQGYINVQ